MSDNQTPIRPVSNALYHWPLTADELDAMAAQYQRNAIAGATDDDPQVDAAGTYTD